MATLPLSDIVNIIVSASASSTALKGFNVGLIIGESTVISASVRTKEYTDTDSMITDSFTSDDAEYKAAVLYFSQSPRPNKVIIGRWDTTGTETITEALIDCRSKNTDWYGVIVCGAIKADIQLAAAYAETASPKAVLFYTTADADVLTDTEGNIFELLKGLSYTRSIGLYSTTADAAAAVMGYAMGANTRLANSAYTLAYKTLVGVTVDDLSSTEVTTIKSNNGNVYISRGNTYTLFENGVVSDGTFFDEIINTDMLANDIQLGIIDLLTSTSKVPQTEDGVTLIVNSITDACEDAVSRGFLAPGIWTAATFKGINTGDMLPNGYAILSDSINSQNAADRANRLAPNIYVLCKLAGAIHTINIQIMVNA
jgi:hypothetical protein